MVMKSSVCQLQEEIESPLTGGGSGITIDAGE